MPIDEEVVSHPKVAGGKELLPVTIVLKSPRFAHQRVDDVAIVDVMLAMSG